MIVICGNSIAEVERDLEMAKTAIRSGKMMGCGGATMADAERGLDILCEIADYHSPIQTHDPCNPKCQCEACANDSDDTLDNIAGVVQEWTDWTNYEVTSYTAMKNIREALENAGYNFDPEEEESDPEFDIDTPEYYIRAITDIATAYDKGYISREQGEQRTAELTSQAHMYLTSADLCKLMAHCAEHL